MSQPWSADAYAEHAGYVPAFGAEVLALLDPRPGERILDLGCGDGVLTAQIAEAGAHVIGVDSSAEMVVAARARGLDARVVDAQALDFGRAFDAVFSNAALHWMREPDLVIEGVRRALKPGGRFVGEMGGEGNVAAVRAAILQALAEQGVDATALDPWYFPSREEYQQRLESAGFMVDAIVLFPRPTVLPAGWTSSPRHSLRPYRPRTVHACAPGLTSLPPRCREPPMARGAPIMSACDSGRD